MRRFKVLNCKQERLVFDIKTRRDNNGNLVSYRQYRTEKAGEGEWYPGAYGHEKIKEGDIIELEGYRADKAAANPDFEEIKKIDVPVKKVDIPPKKRRGRPRKSA